MQISDITRHLETIAPRHLQESYDNAGLIVGDPYAECTGVLFCLDSTEAVVEEAIKLGCNLIIAHHPIVFRGLKQFNGSNYVERTIINAIKYNVGIYACHTNLDNVHLLGVNQRIADMLGLRNTSILMPKDPATNIHIGAGLVGELEVPHTEAAFLQNIKHTMRAACIRHTALLHAPVQRVAVCGGSGSFLLSAAIKAKAQVFITADFKYHEFFDADGRILIADIGHYESEQFTIELLFEIISNKFPNFALHLTKELTNPVKYLV